MRARRPAEPAAGSGPGPMPPRSTPAAQRSGLAAAGNRAVTRFVQRGTGSSTGRGDTEPTKRQPSSIESRLKDVGVVLEGKRDKMRRIQGTNMHISAATVHQDSKDVVRQVRDLVGGAKWTVYRAVPCYHPHWAEACKGQAKPLGTGPADFDTGSAAWTAWQEDLGMAVSVAASISGMRDTDDIEKVKGFSRSDDFVVGVVLGIEVTKASGLCFFNGTEVQIYGFVQAKVVRTIRMGDHLIDLPGLEHYDRRDDGDEDRPPKKLSDIMPGATPASSTDG